MEGAKETTFREQYHHLRIVVKRGIWRTERTVGVFKVWPWPDLAAVWREDRIFSSSFCIVP